ncbi:MAG: DUF504 domain-containing protein [Myxococcaceae bacterium]|nr:DUF504 domain-containing protein [Myxococcaceae bacterium]
MADSELFAATRSGNGSCYRPPRVMDKDPDRHPFPDGQRVYHQLRWDPRFDASACEIVLTDRPTGTKVIAFRDFLPNGPIPWHRIVGFRYRGEVLWDRAARVDRRHEALEGTLGSGAPVVSVELLEPREAEVLPASAPTSDLSERPVVVTWNVLSDTWHGELIDHPARWKRLLDETLSASPELVVFTEATQSFFALLCVHPGIRERYTIVSSEHSDVVLLSRATPLKTARYELAPGREVLTCAFDELVLAGVHLPSDREGSRRAERERDLERICQTLLGSGSLVIAGDLNAADDELRRPGALDAWATATPSAPGLTYDVERNPLAAALTKRGRSGRLDRILVFGDRLTAREARLLGTGPQHLSDHFGLVASLEPTARRVTSHRTAVVLLPPAEAWGPLQRLRARFDERFERWPPHVTLLYGFVEGPQLSPAITRLAEAAAGLTPLELCFDRVITFEHETSTTVALAPSNPAPLRALQARLVEAFPFCLEQNRGEGGTFTPHLSLGRVGSAGDLQTLRREAATLGLTFPAHALTVLERPANTFEVRATIDLGARGAERPPAVLRPPDELERTVRAAVEETLRELDLEASVEPFGSRAWAPSLTGSDLDLLVTLKRGANTILDVLQQRLAPARRVSAQVLRGERFDVVAIDADAGDEDSRRFSLGVADARRLRDRLERHGRAQLFDAVIPRLRAWSRRRALEGNAFGYFGGIGWGVLLASPLLHDPELCGVGPGDAFQAWARWAARLDRRALVCLDPSPRFEADGFTVLSPAQPWRPITRALIASTSATLLDELAHVGEWETSEAIDVNAWLTFRGPATEVGAWLQRCLSIVSALDRELGPVLRVRGEAPLVREGEFTSRVGLRTNDTARAQALASRHLKRLELSQVRVFVDRP